MQIKTSLKVHPQLVGYQFINITCNGNKYRIQLNLGHGQSFFPQFVKTVSTITVLPEYQNVLKIIDLQDNDLQSSKNQFALKQCLKIKEQAKIYFGRNIEIDYAQYAIKLLIHDNDSIISQELAILDSIHLQMLLKIFKTGFDSMSEKLKPRVNRKFKKYINETKRSQEEKNILAQLHKHLKLSQVQSKDIAQKQIKVQTQLTQLEGKVKNSPKKNGRKKKQIEKVQAAEENEDDWEDLDDTKQEVNQEKSNKKVSKKKEQTTTIQSKVIKQKIQPKKQQPNVQSRQFKKEKKTEKNEEENKGRNNKRSYSKPYKGSFSKQKRIDQRIALGIKGDTNDGWRQRARPNKLPAQQLIDNNPNKMEKPKVEKTKKQVLPKQNEQKSEASQKISSNIVLPKPVSLEKIFSYPSDGKNFKFQAGKNYTLVVNSLFNIKIDSTSGTITIHDGKKGYIRKSVIDPINNGFMAQGLTICFDGSCNLEDGGQTFGDPKIQDFTRTDNQWFTLEKLDIFSQK